MATLASRVQAFFFKALIQSLARPRGNCAHDDEAGYAVIDGKTVHCRCGESFAVKCMHLRIDHLLPRVWQCHDCGETRGAGK